MNTEKRNYIILAILLSLGVLTLAVELGFKEGGSGSINLPAETVEIGVLLPLSGNAVGTGEVVRNVLTLALEDRLAKRGGIHGRTIKYITVDGGCNKERAEVAMQELVDAGVKYVIGGLCSSETLAVAPLAEAHKVILMSPTSSNPAVTTAGKYVFRTSPSDADGGKQIARYAFDSGYRKAAIISETDNTYSSGLVDAFSEVFYGMGGEIVMQDTYSGENADKEKLNSTINLLVQEQPDFLYIVSQTEDVMQDILLAANSKNLDVPFLASEDGGNPQIVALGSAVDGLVFAQPGIAQEGRQKVTEFFSRYESRFGPAEHLAPSYMTTSYDAADIIFEVIAQAGYDTRYARNYLHKEIRGYDAVSNPNLFFDEYGDANQRFMLQMLQNGKVVPVEN